MSTLLSVYVLVGKGILASFTVLVLLICLGAKCFLCYAGFWFLFLLKTL